MTTKAKTPTERKADERERHRLAGRMAITVWIHPDDRDRVRRYVERMNKQRFGAEEKPA